MDDARELNKEILRRLGTRREGAVPSKEAHRVMAAIAACPEERGEHALGSLFGKLHAFTTVVDFTHPDLGTAFDGWLAFDSAFANECEELLVVAEYCERERYNSVGPFLWKVLSKELPKDVLRRIDSPFVNRLHVRFLKAPEDREKVRNRKRMQCIDLRSLCKKGDEVWSAQPSSFSKFIRYDMAYQDELARVEKKAKRYLDLGLTDMHSEIMKTVEAFRQQVDESYYGFNRVTMTSAAVILAKSLDYNMHQPFLLAEFSNAREYRIVVEPRHFKGYNFFVEGGGLVLRHPEPTPLLYEPRVYPLHEFWPAASQTVKEIIDLTENFPDANGKPVFDHYGVIVPGVAYPKKDPRFVDDNGNILSFDSIEEAKKALDLTLIKKRCITPVIVGEKDGKCYFIGYWA
jgi:hypothetical protein